MILKFKFLLYFLIPTFFLSSEIPGSITLEENICYSQDKIEYSKVDRGIGSSEKQHVAIAILDAIEYGRPDFAIQFFDSIESKVKLKNLLEYSKKVPFSEDLKNKSASVYFKRNFEESAWYERLYYKVKESSNLKKVEPIFLIRIEFKDNLVNHYAINLTIDEACEGKYKDFLELLPYNGGQVSGPAVNHLIDWKKNEIVNIPNKNLSINLNYISFPEPYKLKGIERLYITGSQKIKTIEDFPAKVWELQSLKELELDAAQLKVLPSGIENLINLEKLFIGFIKLEEIPVGVGDLKQLKYLKIRSHNLTELPEAIGGLERLESIEMVACGKLEKLPNSTGMLKSLKRLIVSNNSNLESLPPSIGGCFQLETVVLHAKNANIPESIQFCKNLESLKIYAAKITIPKSIGELQALRELEMIGSFPIEIAASLGKCKKMEKIVIQPVANVVPATLGELVNIKSATLVGLIDSFLMPLDDLNELQSLNISLGYKYQDRLNEVCNLKKLNELELFFKQFNAEIPYCVADMPDLRKITFNIDYSGLPIFESSFNYVDTLIIKGCPNLKGISRFPNVLYLSSNKNTCNVGLMHSEELRNLNKLEILKLQDCKLNEIPMEILSLNNLKILNLEDNKLDKIPYEINLMQNLQQLVLKGKQYRDCNILPLDYPAIEIY